MNWTTEKPTAEHFGKYFWVKNGHGVVFMAQWDTIGVWRIVDAYANLNYKVVSWYGPLEPPPMGEYSYVDFSRTSLMDESKLTDEQRRQMDADVEKALLPAIHEMDKMIWDRITKNSGK